MGAGAEIFSYESSSMLNAMNWSVRKDKPFRLGVGSFREECTNYVEIIHLDEDKGQLVSNPAFSFRHDYPPTKLMFMPDQEACRPDLMATTGEFLRLWRIGEDSVRLERLLNNNKQSDFCAPLTSFDWCEADPKHLGTSSIDTTCTIWDLERGEVDTQLIAHDKEVYDIAWGGWGVFATVAADGSVRVFDLRDKQHSSIIYECPVPNTPLLRLSWNKQDPRYMATVIMDSSKVVVLDIRYPSLPITELTRHQAPVNGVAWAPHSSAHVCTAGDDSQALIWDMSTLGAGEGVGLDPMLAYSAGAEINQLQWSSAHPDWVAICFSNVAQILRV